MLNGAGVRTRAMFKVYVGSLYLPQKASDAAGVLAKSPRRVQLNLVRNLSNDQIVGALIDGLKEANSDAEFAAVKPQADQLATIMKGVGELKEGDVLTFDFADGATRIGLNGAAKGRDFDKAYIDNEVETHKMVLETLTAAMGAAQNAELQNMIQKAAPTILSHFDMAQSIQRKLK